jgi:hypothetical protein
MRWKNQAVDNEFTHMDLELLTKATSAAKKVLIITSQLMVTHMFNFCTDVSYTHKNNAQTQ